MPNIKQEFIRNILNNEGDRLVNNQGIEIERRLQFHTGRLFRDRIKTVTNDGESGARLTLTFPAYLRMLDIKNLNNKRKKAGKRKAKGGYRIYNRFVMGHYYSIANRVSIEFTDKVVQDIRNTFNTKDYGN